jgi:hypothetical protein
MSIHTRRQPQARTQAPVVREFDAVHSVERARQVGSLEAVVDPRRLRPELIERIRGRRVAHGRTGGRGA